MIPTGYDFGYSQRYPCAKRIKWGYRVFIFAFHVGVVGQLCYVDHYSFEHAASFFVVNANSSVPHPFAKLAEFTQLDGIYLAWYTCLLLLGISVDIFMFYWCDVPLSFMRSKFAALKQNIHWAIFVAFFYGYIMFFALGAGTCGAVFEVMTNQKGYDTDLAVFRAFKAQHNHSLTWHETVNGCCRLRSAWAYMTFPVPTGSVEAGIAMRRLMEPIGLLYFYLHSFWTSAVWSMVLVMLYSEYTASIKDLSWQDINSGKG